MSAADLDVRPVVTRWEVAEAWLAGVVRLYEQDRVGLEARLSQVPHAADPPPGPWTEVEQWVEEIARSIANGSTERWHDLLSAPPPHRRTVGRGLKGRAMASR